MDGGGCAGAGEFREFKCPGNVGDVHEYGRLHAAVVGGQRCGAVGDRLNNAGEYAFGTDPNLASPHPVVPSIATIGSNRFLRVTIPKNPSASDALITVEAGDEVEPANWSAANVIVEINAPTLLQVRDNVPLSSAARRFFASASDSELKLSLLQGSRARCKVSRRTWHLALVPCDLECPHEFAFRTISRSAAPPFAPVAGHAAFGE